MNNFSNENRRQNNIAINAQASKPILADLKNIGFELKWVSDLYNKRIDYRKAIPILIKWLPLIENYDVKEAIVRALSVSWAKHTSASNLLVDEFRNLPTTYDFNIGLKWAIANALSILAEDNVLNDLIEFIRDERHGHARQMLVIALSNMKISSVENLLIELLGDEELVGFAIMALGKLKSKMARQYIEPFLTHQKSWIRKEAKRALAKIDKENID